MRIAVLATLDTKSAEAGFLAERITAQGVEAEVVDTAPHTWLAPASSATRAHVMNTASVAIAESLLPRFLGGELHAVCVLAGATGAALASDLLASLPYGMPKLLVSPVASAELRPYIGASDTIVMSPVVDFTGGRNAYVDFALNRAAAVACGLLSPPTPYPRSPRDHIAASAFGVTSPLTMSLAERVSENGMRLAVFSANGTGGEAFERFVGSGMVRGAFDLTLSELADELCGGALSAGPDRGWAAVRAGIPQVLMPGGLDFINYTTPSSVPSSRRGRAIVEHTPTVTLVRTSAEENEELGRMVGQRAAAAGAATVVIVPTRGFSSLSAPGGPFYDPVADGAFRDGLATVRGVRIEDVDDEMNGRKTLEAVMANCESWEESE